MSGKKHMGNKLKVCLICIMDKNFNHPTTIFKHTQSNKSPQKKYLLNTTVQIVLYFTMHVKSTIQSDVLSLIVAYILRI